MVVFAIIIFVVFVLCFLKIRNTFKNQNPKHSFLDDFLMFTGSPLMLAYILILAFNPNNADKIARDLFSTPLTYCLMGWLVISSVWYLIRYNKNVPKKPSV